MQYSRSMRGDMLVLQAGSSTSGAMVCLRNEGRSTLPETRQLKVAWSDAVGWGEGQGPSAREPAGRPTETMVWLLLATIAGQGRPFAINHATRSFAPPASQPSAAESSNTQT
mmetsp:Transcript_16323/g.41463  ORF Transcript_16323/g.41463 Transcript_16323/m.41463 type:complete len:112 (-) Transcript_16323:180-515(-)